MSRLADIVLALWIVFVGVVYFGGYFFPAIGLATAQLGKVYAVLLIVAVIVLSWRWLTRAPAQSEASQ